MVRKKAAGFTLIEAIMVMIIIAVLVGGGVVFLTGFVQNTLFVSHQLSTDLLASDCMEIMIEGDSQAKGLRFSRSISWARDHMLSFINQDGDRVIYIYSPFNGRIYRWTPYVYGIIPSYNNASSPVTILVNNDKLFTYYDENEQITSDPLRIRAVKIEFIAQTGSGDYAQGQGQTHLTSAVAVKRLE